MTPFLKANIIHTKKADATMKRVSEYIQENSFDKAKGEDLYMKVFISTSMRCGQIFRNLTKDTQMHYLNFTLETQSREHLEPFFEIELDDVFKLSSYKLDAEEANYKQNLLKKGEEMKKKREDIIAKNQPKKPQNEIVPKEWSDSDL